MPNKLDIPLSHLGTAYLIGAAPKHLDLSIRDITGEAVTMRLGVPLEALSGLFEVGDKATITVEMEVVDE